MNFLNRKRYIHGFIVFLVGLIIVVGTGFIYRYYADLRIEKKLESIKKIITHGTVEKESCELILDFQDEDLKEESISILSQFSFIKEKCLHQYDIEYMPINKDSCVRIIKGNKEKYADEYLILEGFDAIQKQCIDEYLGVKFSTGAFFDIENDFKSYVHIDFALPFYEDIDDITSENFIENRDLAKQKLISLLEGEPALAIKKSDITLYPQKAIIALDLEPLKEYTMRVRSFDSEIQGEKTRAESFKIETPEKKYFALRSLEKLTLFEDTRPHQFELLSYDSGKQGTIVKICRIDNESYAKIEVFRESEGLKKEKQEFFTQGIDDIEAYECHEKELVFPEDQYEQTLKRLQFDFTEELGSPARSGLYYVTFSNPEERVFHNRMQEAIFFGVIDSHITMKVGKNGEVFFFVNDFSGKPLANQHIRVYANEFVGFDRQWNRDTETYDTEYFSPLDRQVFSDQIELGITGSDGVLRVNMESKLENTFGKTFSSHMFHNTGDYDSFFITSASDSHLSYVSSKWNGGISGWNFGYTEGGYWWGSGSKNAGEIKLNRGSPLAPDVYTHTYTDRKLYLPGEEIHIKSILRRSKDLSIPVGEDVQIILINSSDEVLLEQNIVINDFGSISTSFLLAEDASLGNYNVTIRSADNTIGVTNFSVEIFEKPKFKNEIMLETQGLNGGLVPIVETETEETQWGYEEKIYLGNFNIQASIRSNYYSGSPVKNAEYIYKVYKQHYYDRSYWSDCFYGCYWEAEKEFYTEGVGKLDENGAAIIDIPVEFASTYADFKYIVEVTIKDHAGDSISGANSVIAKLGSEYKQWNPENGVYLKSRKRFYKRGELLHLDAGVDAGKFTKDYNNKYLLVIKKKDYITTYADDVRGQKRPITRTQETVEKILKINDTNFVLKENGTLEFEYIMQETGEYIFEFGKINEAVSFDLDELISELEETRHRYVSRKFIQALEADSNNLRFLTRYCDKQKENCERNIFLEKWGCRENYISKDCEHTVQNFEYFQRFSASDLISDNHKEYFSLISYGDQNAENPIQSDNKITVLSEKITYNIGETARVLVRLPFSDGKILWTIEKQGVITHEYIDIVGNTFFKEFLVDDVFAPNAYIGVVAMDTDGNCSGGGEGSTDAERACIPEYKVGYTEIVVDKTDKKTDISIDTNKKQYEPREQVHLDIGVKNNKGIGKKSELTVMVVDDSLISLMGNIDVNTLEKFYKKLPFQIQTSITNLAMLRNYYFSRQGIVGGSGFGNFKGGDSAVSSRNIFKNTAYYNPSVITDENGYARVSFELPDNLTNFRVMVLSNSQDNFFGYSEEFIEVRKEVIVEERFPLIIREGDSIELGANIFNTTETELDFKSTLSIDGIIVEQPVILSQIKGGKSRFVSWMIQNPIACPELVQKCEIPYTISVLGDSVKHSDKIEGTIEIKSIPSFMQKSFISQTLGIGERRDFTLTLPENIDINKSQYELAISNNPLLGIEKIVKSLAVYPYGCGEQLLSSTLPNAILKQFDNILGTTGIPTETIDANIAHGLAEIYNNVLSSGAFIYWHGEKQPNIHITSYAVRVLLEIQGSGTEVDTQILESAVGFLEQQYPHLRGLEKAEALWALASYYKSDTAHILGLKNLADEIVAESRDVKIINTKKREAQKSIAVPNMQNGITRHELLAYTYALVLTDPVAYKATIDKNILKIKKDIEAGGASSSYYSTLSDMGEFTQMLIDYRYDMEVIFEYIQQLSQKDWSSYWYSTKAKNNSFLAFMKYITSYGREEINVLNLTLNGVADEISVGGEKNSYRTNKELSHVLQGTNVGLHVENISGGPLFVTAAIDAYPEDPLKIKNFSQGVTLSRTIYEVRDATQLLDNCSWQEDRGGDAKNGSRNTGYICEKAKGLIEHTGNDFKKGTTYKITLRAQFTDNRADHQNVTIEDYIPAGFRILNSKFKTNTIATSQESSSHNSWRWTHVENRPDVVMATSENIREKTVEYSYFIRADFGGDFMYPPAVVYKMYQPDTRGNTEFRRVQVK